MIYVGYNNNRKNSNLNPLTIHNGTHQGCPLLPLLYALKMVHLDLALRANDSIQGLTVGATHHKSALLADNLLMFINSSASTVDLTHPTNFRPVSHNVLV